MSRGSTSTDRYMWSRVPQRGVRGEENIFEKIVGGIYHI